MGGGEASIGSANPARKKGADRSAPFFFNDTAQDPMSSAIHGLHGMSPSRTHFTLKSLLATGLPSSEISTL